MENQDIYTIAIIGRPLGSKQEQFLDDFAKQNNTSRNKIEFINLNGMSNDEIMAQGAFNAVMYSSEIHMMEAGQRLQAVLQSQENPNDISLFATSSANVTDKSMEQQTHIASIYTSGKFDRQVFPIKISNENELNAYMNGVVAPTAFAYFNKVNPITDKTQSKVNSFVDLVMEATKQKHVYTAGHVQRVSKYVENLATQMGLSGKELDEVVLAAKLHDIGKLGIPDEVLASKKALTYNERTQMNYHSQLGEAILENAIAQSPELREQITPAVLEGIKNHHKHYDGYHDRDHQDPIHGEAVGKYALIIAAADCIDAMTSQRAYNNPKHILDTFRDLWKQKGKQFSPEVANEAILMLGKQIAELGVDPNKMFAEPYDSLYFKNIDEDLKNFFKENEDKIKVNEHPEPGLYSSLGFRLNQYGYFEFEGPDAPRWDPQIRVDDEYIFQEGRYARDNRVSVDDLSQGERDEILKNVYKTFERQDNEGKLAMSRAKVQTRDLSEEVEEAVMNDTEYNTRNCTEAATTTVEQYKALQAPEITQEGPSKE